MEADLSAFETAHAEIVRRLRNELIVAPDLYGSIAEFVAHLMVRTKHFRDSVTEGVRGVVESLERQFADPRNRPAWEERLLAAVMREPEVQGVMQRMSRPQRRQMRSQLLERIRKEDPAALAVLAMRAAREAYDFDAAAERAHVQGLSKGFTERSKLLSMLSWTVVMAAPGAFVLGDAGPIARFDSGDSYVHAVTDIAPPRYLLLPIASDRLLVGYRETPPDVDPEAVNREMAELSREFLVAHRCTEREQSYATLLGRRAAFVPPDEHDTVLRLLKGADRSR